MELAFCQHHHSSSGLLFPVKHNWWNWWLLDGSEWWWKRGRLDAEPTWPKYKPACSWPKSWWASLLNVVRKIKKKLGWGWLPKLRFPKRSPSQGPRPGSKTTRRAERANRRKSFSTTTTWMLRKRPSFVRYEGAHRTWDRRTRRKLGWSVFKKVLMGIYVVYVDIWNIQRCRILLWENIERILRVYWWNDESVVVGMLRECWENVERMLRECWENAERMLRECRRNVERTLWECWGWVVAFMSVNSVSISLVEVSIKLPLAKWKLKWKLEKGK